MYNRSEIRFSNVNSLQPLVDYLTTLDYQSWRNAAGHVYWIRSDNLTKRFDICFYPHKREARLTKEHTPYDYSLDLKRDFQQKVPLTSVNQGINKLDP